VPLSATAEEMLDAIRGLFPQLTGGFHMLRCLPKRHLELLTPGVNCPQTMKPVLKRSALHVRPQEEG